MAAGFPDGFGKWRSKKKREQGVGALLPWCGVVVAKVEPSLAENMLGVVISCA